MLGVALDVGFPGDVDLMDDDLLGEMLACGFRGIGRSENRLHIDVRERAYFWRYLANGKHERDARAHLMLKDVSGR